ncbi:BlaI/MecI/CopY family transcriptional regulator [Clostridium sp. HBUAS56010]|uniref:BlaI/MecI/CopY family transcriptional regulator n=1 Tax=Clostridium sp. HBUAS56010 TaxID=2571127 RepID=UPI001178CC82|nr:BlaI/MecI/CopY family transcriptional regulator [Clostridium sp. HBUAS56010]
MEDLKLYDAEFKFMNIVWEFEPISSKELSVVCGERLGWKRPTTYTVIRKLSERGFVKNENATVTALVKREQVQQYEAHNLLDKAFDGSIPSFIATFLKGKSLTEAEAHALQQLIEGAKE